MVINLQAPMLFEMNLNIYSIVVRNEQIPIVPLCRLATTLVCILPWYFFLVWRWFWHLCPNFKVRNVGARYMSPWNLDGQQLYRLLNGFFVDTAAPLKEGPVLSFCEYLENIGRNTATAIV